MTEMVHERAIALADESGRRFDLARIYAEEQPGGTWQGWIEFRSVFLEGALRRATSRQR